MITAELVTMDEADRVLLRLLVDYIEDPEHQPRPKDSMLEHVRALSWRPGLQLAMVVEKGKGSKP